MIATDVSGNERVLDEHQYCDYITASILIVTTEFGPARDEA